MFAILETRKEAISKRALSSWGEVPVSVHPLVKLTRGAPPAASMRHSEVVEHKQVAGAQGKLDLHGIGIQPERRP